ncbi:MAG: hypothetical protein LBC94_03845 [Desulfovibrio sp.]|nr:hypothetical protein [Desulfovibrio sp.]
MYDAEASQERPRIKAGDLVGKNAEELPADIGRSLKKARKAVQTWGQRWDELPDWAKEHIEELEEELGEAKAALLKAKDEAISAQSIALRRTDTLVDNIMKALEDKCFMYTTEELFEAMKSCSTAAELDKLIKQGRKK